MFEKFEKALFLLISVSIIFSFNFIFSVNYSIKARLFPDTKIVRAQEKVVWENHSEKELSFLLFHTYLNAFKNESSTFIKETNIPFKNKPYFKDESEVGWIRIESIKINGEAAKRSYYIQPDDGNLSDQTVLKVELPQSIKPGERAEIEIKFTSKLPKLIARTGYAGKFFMVAQWFPKLAVLDDKGVWNCHQFHRNSEFFSDYGTYYVEITVPAKYKVAGGGVLKDSWKNEDGTKTLCFESKKVHDFSWAAYPYFKVFKRKVYSRKPDIDATIELYTFDSKKWVIDRYLSVVENGLKFFASHYGKYPYKFIKVIDPPPGAERAGGMEYPTLITGGRFSDFLSKYFLKAIEMVTFHEFGHQYWYGIVGSNEFEAAWLDEGLNTFSEIVGMSKFYGKETSLIENKLLGIRLGDYGSAVISMNTSKLYDEINKFSWMFFSGSSYSFNSYHRTALTLMTLKNVYGEGKFWNAMRTYFKTYSYRHPKPEDFLKTVEAVMGERAFFFLKKFIFENGKIDYSVEYVLSVPLRKPSGLFGEKFFSSKNAPLKDKQLYYSEIAVLRDGVSGIPVEIEFVFKNGKRIIKEWDGKERWKKFKFYTYSQLEYAKIDPLNKIAIDRDILNNSKRVEPFLKLSKKLSSYHSLFNTLLFLLLPL